MTRVDRRIKAGAARCLDCDWSNPRCTRERAKVHANLKGHRVEYVGLMADDDRR